MFGTRCNHCGKKTRSSFFFCPHCGGKKKDQSELEREFGLLGFDGMKLPFGFNMLFQNLVKEIDKQFHKIDKEMIEETKKVPLKEGISINITTVGNRPVIEVNKFGGSQEIKKVKITEEMAKKLSTLPKKEAETSVRRLSNKIVYEIDLPGVRNLSDIIISRLESSIEIKAIASDTIFFKLLPLNLPVSGYGFKDGKLVMEFKS